MTTKAKEIIEKQVEDYVQEMFLPYAYSVCLDRALVYDTDGLKPIQRRALFCAYKNGLSDKSAKMKSATFTGRLMDYSPHADAYLAIVNMAEPETEGQPRNLRLPLIKGKGNWGNLDGPAAAARYTEMNLTPAAMELLKELNENAVDMVPNYNGTLDEPKFLPARWPVAIINGVPNGMAVGFACNIPCHNPDEVMDACIELTKNSDLTDAELCKIIKGPDFNCGCDIISDVEKDGKTVNGVREYLKNGSGTFIMKGKYNVEEKGGKYTINFYSLPYQIGPYKVIEAVKKQYEKGHLKELSSWKDLSDMEHPINVEFKTKKGVNVDKIISELYELTPLQSYFAVNNTIIHEGLPQQVNMKTALLGFVEFRKECTKRKLKFRLAKKEQQLHIQEALKAVLLDIDKCIAIIRKSDNEEAARQSLMKTFKIDEGQANYILSLQLRKLTKADEHEIKTNIDELKKAIAEIKKILGDAKKFIQYVVSEMEDTKSVISSPRKCKITKSKDEELDIKDVYLKYKNGKVKRTFKNEGRIFPVDKEGRVLIITYKNGADVRSIYELPDEKYVSMSNFSNISGRPVAVAGTEGFLVLVGIEGTMKMVDLSEVNLPKGQNIKKILAQPVAGAFVVPKVAGGVRLNGKKEIDLKELPVFGISANGNKVWPHKIDSVEFIPPK